VGKRQLHIPCQANVGMVVIYCDVTGFYHEPVTLWHRIMRPGRYLDERCLKLLGVDLNRAKTTCQRR